MFSKEESNLIFSPSPGEMMSQNNLTSHIPEWSGPSLFSRLMLTLLVYLTVFTLFLVLIGVWLVGMWRKEQQRTAAASRPPPSYISMFPQEPPAYHTSKSSINSLRILCLTFCLVVSLMKIIQKKYLSLILLLTFYLHFLDILKEYNFQNRQIEMTGYSFRHLL